MRAASGIIPSRPKSRHVLIAAKRRFTKTCVEATFGTCYGSPDRGRPAAEGNLVSNNIFASCKAGIVFLSANNKADGNVYVAMPSAFQGFVEASSVPANDPDPWRRVQYMGLANWRSTHGWDRNSIEATAEIHFDPETLQLRIVTARALPKSGAVPWMETDLLGTSTGTARIAGPLAGLRAKHLRTVDPRQLS